MQLQTNKKKLFLFIYFVLQFSASYITAQTIRYSRDNIYINNPDDLQLVANVSGRHHLISFSKNEKPQLHIFNAQLNLINTIELPFIFPELAELRIIPFNTYYYVSIHPRLTKAYLFWKVDGDGNAIDLSEAFQKLLQSQSANVKLGYQFIPYHNQFWMVYHTDIDNFEKNTIVMVQTDSLLNLLFAHKVSYDFKREEEKLQQEVLVFDKHLYVLKTQKSGTSLELMKVNLATGFAIHNTFYSSGYFYSQAGLAYNNTDSTVTVSSMLIEPGYNYDPKQYIFISRLNKILIEQVPFTLLKTQFRKKTNTNFILTEGSSRWIRFKKGRGFTTSTDADRKITVYQDPSMSDASNQSAMEVNNMLAKMNTDRTVTYSDEMGVRFSFLDKNFKITEDSLMANTKDSYTIRPDSYTRFNAKNKQYLLVSQLFFRRKNGLLLVNTDDNNKLEYNYVRVNERYNYLLSKSKNIPEEGIIIPYLRRREAGLIKISIE